MILVLTLSRINCAELEEAPTGCEDRLEWKHPTTNETCEDVKVMTNDEKEKICESIDTYKGSTAFSACCGEYRIKIIAWNYMKFEKLFIGNSWIHNF